MLRWIIRLIMVLIQMVGVVNSVGHYLLSIFLADIAEAHGSINSDEAALCCSYCMQSFRRERMFIFILLQFHNKRPMGSAPYFGLKLGGRPIFELSILLLLSTQIGTNSV